MAGERVGEVIICETAKQLCEELGAKAPSTSNLGKGLDYAVL